MKHHDAKYYVNLFVSRTGDYEAHDGVFNARWEAVDAAEQYEYCYAFTLTEYGMVNLRPEFSEKYKEATDLMLRNIARIDMKEGV